MIEDREWEKKNVKWTSNETDVKLGHDDVKIQLREKVSLIQLCS
jgi:hypothetical protein